MLVSTLLWGPAMADASTPVRASATAEASQVHVILFSLPGCHWCDEIRRAWLRPLRHASERDIQVHEFGLDDATPVSGLDGESTQGKRLAERWNVRFAPTILMLDHCGRELAEPLVGGDVAGFYGEYFRRALEAARASLVKSPPEAVCGQ